MFHSPALTFRENPGDDRPHIDQVLNRKNDTIIANQDVTSNLLQLAVIGFGKCGTTSLSLWLQEHPEIELYPEEVYDLMSNRPADLIRKLYQLPVNTGGNKKPFQRGFKSPNDLPLAHAMDYFRTYFPTTKLLVVIRHPVPWFVSLYNMRVQNYDPRAHPDPMPEPVNLIGRCTAKSRNACTYKGEFGLFLRNLGKSLAYKNARRDDNGAFLPTEVEKRMYQAGRFRIPPDIQHTVPNPVFLMELSQLQDAQLVNDTAAQNRWQSLRDNLQHFLQLDSPLSATMPHRKPGRQQTAAEQAARDAQKIQYPAFCTNSYYIPLRQELMRMARSSSWYIQDYLLSLPSTTPAVTVSSPRHFRRLIKNWQIDPCTESANDTRLAGRYILDAIHEERQRERQQVAVKNE